MIHGDVNLKDVGLARKSIIYNVLFQITYKLKMINKIKSYANKIENANTSNKIVQLTCKRENTQAMMRKNGLFQIEDPINRWFLQLYIYIYN